MTSDYSSVTIYIPYGYYVTHLAGMLALSDRFRRLKIAIGGVDRVTVVCLIDSVEARDVDEWTRSNLPGASDRNA